MYHIFAGQYVVACLIAGKAERAFKSQDIHHQTYALREIESACVICKRYASGYNLFYMAELAKYH